MRESRFNSLHGYRRDLEVIMDATSVSHIAICVRDLDKSLGFYRDILGMRVASDVIQDTTTGGSHTSINIPAKPEGRYA